MSIRTQNHVAAPAAIAAVRSPLWDKFLSPKTDATAPSVAGLSEDLDPIDEHRSSKLTLRDPGVIQASRALERGLVENHASEFRDSTRTKGNRTSSTWITIHARMQGTVLSTSGLVIVSRQ